MTLRPSYFQLLLQQKVLVEEVVGQALAARP
jgi:hypothetical protein